MAKRIMWTSTAKQARKDILEYWCRHNKSKVYSEKLSDLFKEKTKMICELNYLGKPTDFEDIRVTLVSHFSIFFKVTEQQIIIVGIWDNRRNPNDLHKNLER